MALLAGSVVLGAVAGCGEDGPNDGPPASVRTSEAPSVPNATVGTTPLTTPDRDPVPVLVVPIVSAELAVDVLLDAVDEAFDPEEPDWGLPEAWHEVAPDLIFAGPATLADPETISGVEIVVRGNGEEVMAVAVEDEDGGCASFVVQVDVDVDDDDEEIIVGWSGEYGPEPDECSGVAALQAWEALTEAEAEGDGAGS